MKTKQMGKNSQGTNTANKHGAGGQNTFLQVSKNVDISQGVRGQETPSPDPKTKPDMPPGPARREYDDTGHEHEHKDPTAHPSR